MHSTYVFIVFRLFLAIREIFRLRELTQWTRLLLRSDALGVSGIFP